MKQNNFNLLPTFLTLCLLSLISSCTKSSTSTPSSPSNPTLGYYVINYTHPISGIQIKDTFIQYNYLGSYYPISKKGISDSCYTLNYIGDALRIKTNPTLSNFQYTVPSTTTNLTSSGQFYISYSFFGSGVNQYNLVAKTGSLNINNISSQSLKLYEGYAGAPKQCYMVNGKWVGTWKDYTTNYSCNGEITFVNSIFE
jgi:hypothetical protein